ncbi:MAG: zinc ribbon domain-containing protein [Oscillospiraceae bacterium]|nr:zinc ribbon domain-containing protein [Oscillospiraceae bacterium]
MGIMDAFMNASRGVTEKTKNATEVNNLERKIEYEKERIFEVFADLGKKYYKNPEEDPAVLKEFCDDVDNRRRRILQMRMELNSIRGYKICPKCDAEVNEKFQFCGVCGARMPEDADEELNSLDSSDYYTESDDFFSSDSVKTY